MIGPGKAFDTDRYFVISTNLLGGCRGTTGPSSIDPKTGRPYGLDFPVITVADMVRTERAFLDELGIERVAAVAGGSLGGMQAFEWAILFPDQVDAVVAIASTHALHPQGVAWNAIAREAIMGDPAWRDGHYHGTEDAPNAGMGVAHDRATSTYLSAAGFSDKFRLAVSSPTTSATVAEFEVEATCANRRTRSSPVPTPTPTSTRRGADATSTSRGSTARLSSHARRSRACRPDAADRLQLGLAVPPSASREIEEALSALGKPVRLHVIGAPYSPTASCSKRRGRRRSFAAFWAVR
jgi:homoserine O-acetyltransferase